MEKQVPAKAKILKVLRLILSAIVVLSIVALVFVGALTYRITHPSPAPEPVTPADFLMPSENVSWLSEDGVKFEGYLIAGLKGAPGIVLAPGYGMSRSMALSLAASLRKKGFHSLVYEQRGSGASPRGSSSLGLRETQDMLHALNYLRSRPEADPAHSGIWGVDIGARAALMAAASRRQVQAIVADSVYDSIEDFLNIAVRETSGISNRLIEFGCRQGFLLYQLTAPRSLIEKLPRAALANRKILFIAGKNRAALAQLTRSLYEELQPRQEIVTLATARTRMMSGADLATYDSEVSNFFSQNLALPKDRSERGRALNDDGLEGNDDFQHLTSHGKDK